MNRSLFKKALIFFSVIFVISKIITIFWWTYYAWNWDAPIFKLIEALMVVSSTPVLLVLGIGWAIFLATANGKDTNDSTVEKDPNIKIIAGDVNYGEPKPIKTPNNFLEAIKTLFFIISLIILGLLVVSILKAPFTGYYCSICGFTGGGGGTTLYGAEALEFALFAGTLYFIAVPIFPICLVYVILYIVKAKKKKRERLRAQAANNNNNPEKTDE